MALAQGLTTNDVKQLLIFESHTYSGLKALHILRQKLQQLLSAVTFQHWMTGAGHVIFGLLVLYAGLYAWPRMLMVDGAYQVFELWQNEHYIIVLGRWITMLYQTPPLLATMAGAHIDTIVVVYSVSIVGTLWLCYSLMAHLLRQTWHALALACALAIAWQNSFYFAIGEHMLVFSLMCVLWAWGARLLQRPASYLHYGLWTIAVAVVASQHFLFGTTLAFLVATEVSLQELKLRNRLVAGLKMILLAGLALLAANIYLNHNSEIWNEKTTVLDHNLALPIAQWFGPVFHTFWHQFLHSGALLALLATTVLLAWQRRWLPLLPLWLGTALYLVLISIYNLRGAAPFYLHLYGLLPVMLCLVICLRLWAMVPWPRLALTLWLAGAGLGLWHLQHLHHHYQARIDWMAALLADAPEPGLKIDRSCLPMHLIEDDWALHYESSLYTTHLGRPRMLITEPPAWALLPIPSKVFPHLRKLRPVPGPCPKAQGSENMHTP